MHLVMMTRGIKHEVDFFINELSTRYLPWKKYNPKLKKLEDVMLQLRVSPIQLWDISFGEDNMDAVLNTVLAGNKGDPIHARHKKFLWPLKKAMKLKDIPEYKKDKVLSMKPPAHIELIGIGVKDDYWIEPDGRHVSKKEKSSLAYEGI